MQWTNRSTDENEGTDEIDVFKKWTKWWNESNYDMNRDEMTALSKWMKWKVLDFKFNFYFFFLHKIKLETKSYASSLSSLKIFCFRLKIKNFLRNIPSYWTETLENFSKTCLICWSKSFKTTLSKWTVFWQTSYFLEVSFCVFYITEKKQIPKLQVNS
jgi:hypothetical protein